MLELKEYIQVDQSTVKNIMPLSATMILGKREDDACPSRFLGAIIQITSRIWGKRECQSRFG